MHTLPAARDTYRHGDLRRSLLEAGLALARDHGPEAVVLREVTRQAGVVPNAAYRHFANREALLAAVRAAAVGRVAAAIEAEMARVDAGLPLVERARANLRAVGMAYLRFAVRETGLFRTAFSVPKAAPEAPVTDMAGPTGLNPFELLGSALDMMVEAGLVTADRRPGAEYLAWSSVHGFATLVVDGPLFAMSEADRDTIGDRLVTMVEKGL